MKKIVFGNSADCPGGDEQRGAAGGGAGEPSGHRGPGQAAHGPEAGPVQRTL